MGRAASLLQTSRSNPSVALSLSHRGSASARVGARSAAGM